MTADILKNGNVLSPNWPADVDKYDTLVSTNKIEHDHPPEEILVKSDLILDGKSIEGVLTKTQFCWCASYSSTKTRKHRSSSHMILAQNILLVRYEQKREKRKTSMNEIEMFPSQYFSIHFAKKFKHHKWKYSHITFQTTDSETCQIWVDGLQSIISELTRPQSLLIFINPVGGKKQAQKIFNDKVAPLFDLAKVKQNIIITERMNHAKDFLLTEDLSSYDGVISVGGDGMFSEIINGLLKYEEDEHKVSSSKQGKPLTLGIIPAGSTDTVSYCTSGTNCPVTAALHIILGDELPLDVCSVWHDESFVKYSVSLMGYGYFGDLAKESEALRWMGPKRYEFAGFKRFMANKSYEGEISFIETDALAPSTSPQVRSQCTSGCERCSMFLDDDFDATDFSNQQDNWKTVSGRFISVIATNISCRCARSTTGLSPYSHTGDGHIDLILIRKTTRTKYLHHLIRVSDKSPNNNVISCKWLYDQGHWRQERVALKTLFTSTFRKRVLSKDVDVKIQFDFNFIDVHQVKEFKFKPITSPSSNHNAEDNTITSPSTNLSTDYSTNGESSRQTNNHTESGRPSDTSVWNVDGEILEIPDIHIKVHRQLVKVYARGIEE